MKYIITLLLIGLFIPVLVFACIPDKPTCDVGYWEGEWNGSEWVGKCKTTNGASWIQHLPKVSWARYENGTIDWLFSKFAIGKVVCDRESQEFALDVWGRPFNGTLVAPVLEENYGYDIILDWETYGTYHRYDIPDWMTGRYYCRTISTYMGHEILSQEIVVE